jgi:hypothetical protein
MNRYTRTSRARAIGKSVLVMLAVVAPTLGFAVSMQPQNSNLVSIGAAPAYADCEGPPPRPDLDNCGNPLPTPTPTPDDH